MKYEVIWGINEKCKSMKNHKIKMMKMKMRIQKNDEE